MIGLFDKYEYKIFNASAYWANTPALLKKLNEMGNEGWEVVNFPLIDTNNMLLKRKIVTNSL